MTIRNTYSAESWDKVYSAFNQINFSSYDFDTIKESLLQYLKIYHAENFNDFIESSELIALLELFAYVGELLAYRVDMAAHENFITTAQRKESVLRLARLISYRAARNIPARGLVKINTIRTNESIFDSLGNNLANTVITWNDPNNTNWKEQFFLVANRVMTSRFGQPSKSFQVGDVLMQQYTLNNRENSFRNGVYPFTAAASSSSLQMEVVPVDIDENGPFERSPDINSQHALLYASDGRGDGSDYTGFLMFVKQGSLVRTEYVIDEPIGNRRIELDLANVNDTDVWVYRVDEAGTITESWKRVEALAEQNIYFNDDDSTRKKYEVETLERDRVALVFGDGNFSDAPLGTMHIWTRVSENQTITIPKNRISDEPLAFSYSTPAGASFSCDVTFSLTAALQNNAPSETVEHIRQSAPTTYYAQNRMVSGQDYNTYMLRDPTILRLKSINRTFAGQPKYIEWNDASNAYQNVKLFGDDLTKYYDVSHDSLETRSSSKTLIDGFIEPLLQDNGVFNALNHVSAHDPDSYGVISYPRRRFIEDNRIRYFDGKTGLPVTPYGRNNSLAEKTGTLNEKSAIQAALDQHWYGEPLSYVTINNIRHGVIPDPVLNPQLKDTLYLADLPRTIDGVNTYPPGDTGSGLQVSASQQNFGLRFNRFLKAFGNGAITLLRSGEALPEPVIAAGADNANKNKPEVFTIEMTSDKLTFTVISNLRGKLTDYVLTSTSYSAQNPNAPVDFIILQGTVEFEAGDAFIIESKFDNLEWRASVRSVGLSRAVNLNGWWEVVPREDLVEAGLFNGGPADGPNDVERMRFDLREAGPLDAISGDNEFRKIRANSWVFLVAKNDSLTTGETDSWFIYNRSMKVVAESQATKFWYNQNSQIIDSETKKPVFDKIRILRSNLDSEGSPLNQAEIYDVVGFVYDDSGAIDFNKLEVMPTNITNFGGNSDTSPHNILQFEEFSSKSYEFYLIDVTDPTNPRRISWTDTSTRIAYDYIPCGAYEYISGYDTSIYDSSEYDSGRLLIPNVGLFSFEPGDMVSSNVFDNKKIARRRRVPSVSIFNYVKDSSGNVVSTTINCNVDKGLDFMWQHFSPQTNLIDPSVTNIHDTFILTRGYYSNVTDYVRDLSTVEPQPPTPMELRTSYGYLLQNKMLSDTVVLHSGKLKLLFGSKADQRVRAKFRVIKSPFATFSDERIKSEVIAVVNTYFDIQNWDFGEKFYATELIGLIHQRLSTQIASVVLVPMYSVNSFGSLFTIDSGFDEILQSCATLDDVEIVAELTPTVLRQIR